MEDKGKGFSLRHKKSRRGAVADTPRQISHPIKADAQHAPSRRPARAQSKGDALNANTSDLVKRRYSTRFNNLPDFSNASAPPVPSIPAIPPQFTTPDYHPGTAWQKIPLDINALKNPDLSVEEYSKNFLSDASDQELRDHQAALRKLKEQASADLQHNVFQNRTQFIKISKEAEKLKSEMRVLRGLMAEVTTSLSQASINAGAPEPRAALDEGARIRARKQANRSSVANLEAMWSTQLQALWKNVEGSQKFLPAIPGRHIVLEQSTWIELDAATWKPGRKAHLFLLNDHLMVAQRRKRRIDPNVIANGDSAQKSSSRTVADKCWPLQDIDIIDLASVRGNNNEDMANAISIQYGKESCTYRSEKSSNTDKTNFLLHFRRTADELKRAFHADIEEQTSKSKETLNSLTSRDPSLTDKPELLKTLTSNTTRPDILIEVDGKHQNLRWVEGQIDELDSEVALQQFEDAVRRVEKLRRLTKGLKGNTIAQNLINTKVDERAKKLSETLTLHLSTTHNSLTATQTNIAHLVRLNFTPLALSTYLAARSSVITTRARQIMFTGDLRNHIFQLSYVYFTLIKNTVSTFQKCFPPAMMSACVKWAKERLDDFNGVLGKQLGSVRKGSETWRDCVEKAREHAGMTAEVGLDFRDLVGPVMGMASVDYEARERIEGSTEASNGEHR